ncbi:ParB/RepB/Spo0J family partition protein [Amycolatopsis solani]|uniref:ParB/RepB/Spo0J family partition protein n=1 Tax=Amycolatopsis solani TaxID=3028615 RepID=UPI00296E2EC6|nr:ParB N-terminal domain-containing protein [Amycolatopsis sp. MEP2-6]
MTVTAVSAEENTADPLNRESRFYSNVVNVPIRDLAPFAAAPRTVEDAEHVRLLAESAIAPPPIVVHRATTQVIDGLHRVRAAQSRGETTIAAVFFDGDVKEAFVLAVKLNAMHGLPLTLADRKAAAREILFLYPQWSDRRIAGVAGLSPKTVAAIRRRSDGEIPRPTGRLASNGVLYRSTEQARRRAAELFEADPDASAREVALAAGVSVTTAKDVRKRLRGGEEPVSRKESKPARAAAIGTAGPGADPAYVLDRMRRDPALRFTESGRAVLRWLEVPFGGADLKTVVDKIPSHCAPGLAEVARQRSRDWDQLAELLDHCT